MPRYYFPSWDGDSFVPEEEGLDLKSVELARAMAVRSLVEMARDRLDGSSGRRVFKICVSVEDPESAVTELRLIFEGVPDG